MKNLRAKFVLMVVILLQVAGIAMMKTTHQMRDLSMLLAHHIMSIQTGMLIQEPQTTSQANWKNSQLVTDTMVVIRFIQQVE